MMSGMRTIQDQCTPAQRLTLDKWAESRLIQPPSRVVFNNGRFYVKLGKRDRRESGSDYGSYGLMDWNYVRREVKKYIREQAEEREAEAQRTIGAFI